MANYKIIWEIDIFDEDTPEEAALKAWEIQHREDSIATVYKVIDTETKVETEVDLDEEYSQD